MQSRRERVRSYEWWRFPDHHFWPVTGLAILAVPIIDALFIPRLIPTRFWQEGVYKLLWILPYAVCWHAGLCCVVSARSRIWSGVLQSLGLVYISFAEFSITRGRTLFGVIGSEDTVALAVLWSVGTLVYTSLFASLTHVAHRRWFINRAHGVCACCGYSLHGLPSHRCPECGTPFAPHEGESSPPAAN